MTESVDVIPGLSSTSTPCKGCVFAKYDGKTQVGCAAGDRVEKFKAAGIEVIDVYDDDSEFFLIKNKICLYYRDRDAHEGADDSYKEQLFLDIRKSLKIPYQAIVFFRKNDSLEDLEKRLTELQSQHVKPHLVTVIDRSHSADKRSGIIMKMLHNDFSFNYWRVQEVSAIDQIDSDVVDICYDTTKRTKYFFYTIFESSFPIPQDFSKEIHEAIHEKMQAFTYLLENEDGIGRTVLKVAHEKYAGNSFGIELQDKLQHYNDSVSLIKKVEDICPSLQK